MDKKYLPDLSLAPVATSGDYNDLSDTPTIYTDVVRYTTAQNLLPGNRNIARANIGAVSYESQSLSDTQKAQARTNIGAGTSHFSGNYNDLTNKPTKYTHPSTHPSSMITGLAHIAITGNYNDIEKAPVGLFFESSDSFDCATISPVDQQVCQTFYNDYLIPDEKVYLIINNKMFLLTVKQWYESSTDSYWRYIGNISLHNVNYPTNEEEKDVCVMISYSDNYLNKYGSIMGYYQTPNGIQGSYDFQIIPFSKATFKQLDESYIPSTVPVIPTASVGQTIAVKSVDDAGKPTEWEATRLLKSINGTEPDENGDFALIENKTWQVVEMSSMPGMLNAYGVDAAEVSSYLRNNVHNHSTFYRVIMKTDDSIETRPHTHVVTISQDDGTNDVIIYHGDDLAPIIVDVSENTFTLDPDWVAPAEPVIIPDTAEADMHLTTDMDGNKVWVKNADYVTADEVNGLISDALSKFVNAEEVSY